MDTRKNELKPELLSVGALNIFPGCSSSSRVQMFAGHLGQRLVVSGANERRIQTGMEDEFGKYTFKIEMPVDGQVIQIIDKYRQTNDITNIAFTPSTLVIFEDINTKEVGCIEITRFNSHHQYFGYQHKPGPGMNMLMTGAIIPKGTVFMDSPAVNDNGGYMYGVDLNVAFMSHPSVSEDGMAIRRGALSKFKYKTYETRVVEFGSKYFPLNLYGTPGKFKSFPDIGEYIKDSGILMVLRSKDADLSPVEQSIYDVCEADNVFDKSIYAGRGGGRVVDIQVQHDTGSYSPTPLGMDEHLSKYVDSTNFFYQTIIDTVAKLRRKRGDALTLSRELHRLSVEAYAAIAGTDPNQKITKIFRKAPVDDYRITFTIEYELTPNVGSKLTGCYGDKGVLVQILEDHEAPVDADGNVADIITDPYSTISRMNIGRKYEQYINAASRDLVKHIRSTMGIAVDEKYPDMKVQDIYYNSPQAVLKIFDYLNAYYRICSPRMADGMMKFSDEEKVGHLKYVVKNGIYLYIPTDNPIEVVDMLKGIKEHFNPIWTPVTYIGNSGKKRTTKDNIRIGSMYIMLLEKTGDDWGAVSSAKFQHFGIPSKLTKADKYSAPTRHQPVRGIGETEGRLLASYVGSIGTAEIMDRNNSPITHKLVVESIINADYPTNIPVAVDRSKHPLGGVKPLQLVKHIGYCAGWRFKFNSTKGKETIQYHAFESKS